MECFQVLPVYIWFFLKAGERLNYLSQTFLRNVIIYFDLNGNLLLRLLRPGFHACLLSRPYLPNKVFLYSWLLHNSGKKNRLHLQVYPASHWKKNGNIKITLCKFMGFPDSSVGKDSACNAGDPGSISGSGRSTGEGIGYPLHMPRLFVLSSLVMQSLVWLLILFYKNQKTT